MSRKSGPFYLMCRFAGIILCFTLSFTASSEEPYKTLYSFGAGSRAGKPQGVLTEGADGCLYGVADGGLYNAGVIYRMAKDASTGVQDVYNFRAPTQAYLLHATDGKVYVATRSDGTNAAGMICRMNRDGTEFQVLHEFGSAAGDGLNPGTALLESEGRLFGTTSAGGAYGGGTVFRLESDGSGYELLCSFEGIFDGNPRAPASQLVDGQDGWLYGLSRSGGTNWGGHSIESARTVPALLCCTTF
jgi:uncharacterized repeat protein (TIGR03803 family)